MSLLLMSRTAGRPFVCEQLNIRIGSVQELCYVIGRYPLMALDGLVGEALIRWLDTELGEHRLAEALTQAAKAGEKSGNQLLMILEAGNYYRAEEIREFRNRLLRLKDLPESELLRENGKACFAAEQYSAAEEKLTAAAEELKTRIFAAEGRAEEAERLQAERAQVYCDLAAVRMQLFDRAGALRYLDQAEAAGNCLRAEEYRYLITGAADLPEEKKAELEERKNRIAEKVRDSEAVRLIRPAGTETGRAAAISGEEASASCGSGFFEEAGRILQEWKKEYRRTS